jgi:cytoskeletal protein RodZ
MTAQENITAPPREGGVAGRHLQKLRQEKEVTIEEVALETKISRANLRAIEAMEYERLPADTFTKGFIILYGEYLGVDGRKIANQFFIERDGGKKNSSFSKKGLPSHSLSPKKLAEPAHISSATIAGFLLLLIVLSFSGFCFYFSWNPFAYLTNRTLSLSSSMINTFHPADPATGNEKAHTTLDLKARFLKDTRIIIALDNNESIQQAYASGTNAHWEAEKQIHLEFFQPDSAELRLNNTEIPFPSPVNGRYILKIPAAATAP